MGIERGRILMLRNEKKSVKGREEKVLMKKNRWLWQAYGEEQKGDKCLLSGANEWPIPPPAYCRITTKVSLAHNLKLYSIYQSLNSQAGLW